jgi:hypothetical protein
MLKKTVITIAVILLLMSSWYVISPTSAEVSRVPGVAAGDWAKYGFTFNYSTNDPNPTMTEPPFGEIEYYKLEVQSVDNTNVTYLTMMHYKNGTETSFSGWIDVSSGQINYGYSGFGTFIAANLTAGDKIYLNPYSLEINTTSVGRYAGTQREVNGFSTTQNLTSLQQIWHSEFGFFWDKLSGIFVAFNESMEFTDTAKGYTTNLAVSAIITETNIWTPTPTVEAKVFIVPKFINLKSKGKWILALIELPKGYKAKNVDLSTVMMNGTIPAKGKAMIIGKRWLLVIFSRSEVISLILNNTNSKAKFLTTTLTITGKFSDGSTFQGSDKVVAMLSPFKHFKTHPF